MPYRASTRRNPPQPRGRQALKTMISGQRFGPAPDPYPTQPGPRPVSDRTLPEPAPGFGTMPIGGTLPSIGPTPVSPGGPMLPYNPEQPPGNGGGELRPLPYPDPGYDRPIPQPGRPMPVMPQPYPGGGRPMPVMPQPGPGGRPMPMLPQPGNPGNPRPIPDQWRIPTPPGGNNWGSNPGGTLPVQPSPQPANGLDALRAQFAGRRRSPQPSKGMDPYPQPVNPGRRLGS